ncbi:MAG: FAD-dependent oxidoreductase [Stellaceae bacterium]
MSDAQTPMTGIDFAEGIDFEQLADGTPLLGHVGDELVLLTRKGEEVFATGATCTHYGGPLAEGLLVGDTIRCPWHHASFNLRTGEALRPPALNPIACFTIERQGSTIHVRGKRAPTPRRPAVSAADAPRSVVILGGGAAGNCAAETLRHEGYAGRLTLVSADSSVPYDRPNLSKDYLAGNAQEEWIPLRSPEFYQDNGIELRLATRATAIHTGPREIEFQDGSRLPFDTLLIATGAEAAHLDIPGADLPHVQYLHSLSDSRAIIKLAEAAKRAVIIGASFIGLEVAGSLRSRNIEVHVVAPEAIPMERILGRELGGLVRTIHEAHGVHFHLGTMPSSIDGTGITLQTGEKLPADLIVVGIGVRPNLDLAEKAGIAIDRGVNVDEYLETNMPGIFAAGDLARWPDLLTGDRIRVEHWVVAERQGQVAARNMLGSRERFNAIPFFWSAHYDVQILYVGHAERWDRVEIGGRIEARDCTVTYFRDNRALAVATIGRDLESLRAELDLESR